MEIREEIKYLEDLKRTNKYLQEDCEKLIKILKWVLEEEVS